MTDGLYSLRTTPTGWRVTKFDDSYNVVSSYDMHMLDDVLHCTCPAQARFSCRHRQMFYVLLPKVDSNWLYDKEAEQWRQLVGPLAEEPTIDDDTFKAAKEIASDSYREFGPSEGAQVSASAPPLDPEGGAGMDTPPVTSPPSNFKRRI